MDPSIPLTWRKRCELIKPGLPLLIVSGVVVAEIVALRIWLNGQDLLANLSLLLLALFGPTAGLLAASELALRINHWMKRQLRFGTKGIQITHAKYGNIRWNWIKRWLLEPVPEHPQLAKLTVRYAIDRKGKSQRHWSIVLAHPDQTRALKSELDHLRERGIMSAPVIELTEPATSQQKPFRFRLRGIVQLALALYFFIHGIPILATGISQPEGSQQQSSDSTLTEAQRQKQGRSMTRYFSSEKELRRFFLSKGATMTALGVLFYIWGMAVARKGRDSTQNNATSNDCTQ